MAPGDSFADTVGESNHLVTYGNTQGINKELIK